MKKHAVIPVLFAFLATPCFAGVTFQADEAPGVKPWESPATISWVHNGDGSSNGTIDAVLKYTKKMNQSTESEETVNAVQQRYSFGAYIHYDSSNSDPRNDRGVMFGYGGTFWSDILNGESNNSIDWAANISLGKTLQTVTDSTGETSNVDKNKDRETLFIYGFHMFPVAGSPNSNPKPFITFLTGRTGFYSDHSSGGNGAGSGRLSGVLGDFGINIAPFGLNIDAIKYRNIGIVPTILLAAQIEHDLANSGLRTKGTYRLYTAALALNFGTLKQNGEQKQIIPSFNLSRTVGTDILTGRSYQAKTEISLGLTF
jgi:hypothetical protein